LLDSLPVLAAVAESAPSSQWGWRQSTGACILVAVRGRYFQMSLLQQFDPVITKMRSLMNFTTLKSWEMNM